MKIGVLSNFNRIGNRETVTEFVCFLREHGFEIIEFTAADDVKNVDLCVVLGGDGTILRAVGSTVKQGIEIIGVNYGTLGFLAEFEKNEKEEIIDLLRSIERGDCPILRRSVLEVTHGEKTYYALNEIVVRREYGGENTGMLRLGIKINGEEGEELFGDGALLCTPTGSTAYSLSAGGAIVDPRCPVYMLTPVCAFSANARPVVLPETDVTTVTALRSEGLLLVDGKTVGTLPAGEEIVVKKAPFTADFPERKRYAFLKKVWMKLK